MQKPPKRVAFFVSYYAKTHSNDCIKNLIFIIDLVAKSIADERTSTQSCSIK